jgi:hypothetical protein
MGKVSAMTSTANLDSSSDLIMLIYDADGTPLSRKMRAGDLIKGLLGYVLTTEGDVMYRNSTGVTRLAIGGTTETLGVDSTGTKIQWE